MRKASVLSVALLLVTLVAGFLGGVAWQRSQVASAAQTDEGVDDPRRDRGERRMVIDEVGLEPAKRAEVEEIIQHFMVGMRSLYEEFEPYRERVEALNDEYEQAYRPKQRELFRQARDSIKSILAPGQRALYDSLLAARYGNSDGGRDESGADGSGDRSDRGGER